MIGVRVDDVQEQVCQLEELATLPPTMERILDIVQDETSNAMDLADEVARDHALTAKILKSVNSGYYGFQRQILTIPEAVVILGFNEVERLALSISVVNMFGHDRDGVQRMKSLWRHSLACSIAAGVFEFEQVARNAAVRGAHVAGLLHDVGKAVIMQYFPDASMAISHLIREEKATPLDAESELFDGVTHCDIGFWLAEMWRLPHALAECIAFHHSPDEAPDDNALVHITHIADQVCNGLGMTCSGLVEEPQVHGASREAVGLTSDLVGTIRGQLDKNRDLINSVANGSMF
jgi:HD-like signal output (HDOD) protein